MQTGAGGRGGGRRKRAGGRENPRSPLSVPGLGGGRCPQVDAVPGPFPPLPPPQLLPGRRCCSRPAPRPAPDPLRFCSAAVGAAPGKRGLPPALPCRASAPPGPGGCPWTLASLPAFAGVYPRLGFWGRRGTPVAAWRPCPPTPGPTACPLPKGWPCSGG